VGTGVDDDAPRDVDVVGGAEPDVVAELDARGARGRVGTVHRGAQRLLGVDAHAAGGARGTLVGGGSGRRCGGCGGRRTGLVRGGRHRGHAEPGTAETEGEQGGGRAARDP
jgi:hypothetical protein